MPLSNAPPPRDMAACSCSSVVSNLRPLRRPRHRAAGVSESTEMFDQLYGLDLTVLYPATMILIAGAAALGAWIGRRVRRGATERADISTLTGAALGLLALLLAFSFSLAL